MNATHIHETLYKSSDFLEYLTTFFKTYPCFLCGTIHDFHNHGKILRLIRDNTTYENVSITIFVLFCPISKKAKTQYTKRMLPAFVIPECNITLENSLEMIKRFPQKPIDYDTACEMLGTYCEKTVNRHYKQISEILQETTNLLMMWLASHPLLTVLPAPTPEQSLFGIYLKTNEALIDSQEKLNGYSNDKIDIQLIPAYVFLLKKTRELLQVPLDLGCLVHFLYDTS